MKHSRTLIQNIIVFSMSGFLATTGWAFSAARHYQVPNAWLAESPTEDIALLAVESQDQSGSSQNRNAEGFAAGTQHILKTNLAGIEKYNAGPLNRYPLKFISFDLGVGLGGNVGVLMLRGTSAIQLYWTKKLPPKKDVKVAFAIAEVPIVGNGNDQSPQSFEETESGLAISNTSAVDDQVHLISKAIYATGKVKENPQLEPSLRRVANQFFQLMERARISSSPQWTLGRMRMDLIVSGSGTVHTGLTVGGIVRVRLQWMPEGQHSPAKDFNDPILDPALDKVASGVHSVVQNILNHLSDWSEYRPFVAYKPQLIRIGLGVTTGFNVGVVRGGAGSLIHATFRPINPAPAPKKAMFSAPMALASDSEIPLLANDSVKSWAEVFGMEAPPEAQLQMISNDMIGPMTLSREQIHKGMNKAVEMGKFFIEQGKVASQNSAWELFRIKTNLDFMIGGKTSVATVNGLVSMEVAFQKDRK